MIALPQESQAKLQQLKRTTGELDIQLAEQRARLNASRSRSRQLYRELNFRERHLGGHLGGDKQKVARYRQMQRETSDRHKACLDLEIQLKSYERELDSLLHQLLLENDPHYAALQRRIDSGRLACDALGELSNVVKGLLRDVNEAKTSLLMTGIAIRVPIPIGTRDLDGGAVELLNRALQIYENAIDVFSPRAAQGFLTVSQARLRVEADPQRLYENGTEDLDNNELSEIKMQLEQLRERVGCIQAELRGTVEYLMKQLRAHRVGTLEDIAC